MLVLLTFLVVLLNQKCHSVHVVEHEFIIFQLLIYTAAMADMTRWWPKAAHQDKYLMEKQWEKKKRKSSEGKTTCSK